MTLQWATLLLEIAAATTSVVVAHKKRSYRPVALFLCIIASADLLRLILLTSILRPALEAALARGVQPADVPFTGLARAAGLADRAFFLLWPAGFAALAVRVFLERSPWPVAIVYAIAVIGAIWGYPEIRGSSLRSYYLAAEIAALTVATDGRIFVSTADMPAIDLSGREVLTVVALTEGEACEAKKALDDAAAEATAQIFGRLAQEP